MQAVTFDTQQVIGRSNVWNVPNTDKRLCHNNEECENIALLTCSKCRFHKYCSKRCRKAAWPKHKLECVEYESEPVHAIVSLERGQLNYYKDPEAPRSIDRPNVCIHVEHTIRPMHTVQHFFTKWWCEHNHRIGYFGDARFSKTMVIFHNKEDAEAFFDMFSGIAQLIGQENFDTMIRVVNKATDQADRALLLQEWSRPKSKVRILIVSPADDDELVAPDVEHIIVFEQEHPQRQHTRWQRMARMAGHKGIYMAISPTDELLTHYHFGKIPAELEPDVWRPRTWEENRHRIFKNVILFKGLPKEAIDGFTRDHVCDAVYRKEAYFKDETLLFKEQHVG